jgi:hypothetical protein
VIETCLKQSGEAGGGLSHMSSRPGVTIDRLRCRSRPPFCHIELDQLHLGDTYPRTHPIAIGVLVPFLRDEKVHIAILQANAETCFIGDFVKTQLI